MFTLKMRPRNLSGLLATLAIGWLAWNAPLSQAVTFDFEPPTYTAGALVGQDGWIQNGYVGAPNGAVNVSSTTPLSGSQSVSYTQTTTDTFGDVGKFTGILVPAIQGTDLTVSYTIKATTGLSAPNSGVFLGNGAPGGASPIFARINGGVAEVGSAGGIVPINSFFFLEGEKLKMTYELDFNTDSMNLILENLDFPGSPVSGNYPFFVPYGGPTGPNGEYVVDTGILFRGGNVQVDDITFTLGVGPIDTDYAWTATGSGNWNQTSNWGPAGIPGTLPGRQTVTLGSAITATETIYNNSSRNLNALIFDNSNSYIVAGPGNLVFQADTSGPSTIDPTISVVSGAHQLQLAVNLADNTSVTVASGASLAFNNQIDLAGHTLTTTGNVSINHSTIGGGALVSLGALATSGTADIGGDLVSAGALQVSVDENGSDMFNVFGDATLSGTLDVDWNPASTPSGPVTVLSSRGTLDASGLSLAANDARYFALGADGNNLTLTFWGVAVPEPGTFCLMLVGIIGFLGNQRVRRATLCAVPMIACVVALTLAQPASAVSFNFENPPFVAGPLVGQNGWANAGYITADPFFGGVANGTVDVSTSNPIAGSQSVLYNQAVVPPLAGGTGGADVSKPYAVFGVKDGTTAIDVTASVQIRADKNSIGDGSAGFFLGKGGGSPILLLIGAANSASGTGSISIGDGPALPNVATYIPNNTYEFRLGLDLDNFKYEAFAKNLTAGTPEVNLTAGLPDGRATFFGGINFPNDGDGITTTFDATVILRSGAARVDELTAVGSDFTEARWTGASGNWNQNNAWIPNIVPNVPTGNAPIASFAGPTPTANTAYSNTAQTVNGLKFDNANKYVIAGGGSISLKANTIGGTVAPTVNVLQGSHEMQIPVNLLANANVTTAANSSLDFNNTLNFGGKTLSNSGDGVLNLNVSVTGGGAIVNSGTLGTAGTTAVDGSLNSTGKLVFNLGPNNTDFFDLTGNATLSGILDVVLEPGFTPSGSYTLLTTDGTLNAGSLALDASDLGMFSLGVSGKSLVLTAGGVGIPGDFNHDTIVNAADLTKWQGDYGVNGNSDANGDNKSDGLDFLVWQRNFGTGAAVSATSAVPEPTSLLLGAMAFAGVASMTRRRV